MLIAARGADEGKVEVGILKLGMVGKDLVYKQRDRLAIIIPSDRVSFSDKRNC